MQTIDTLITNARILTMDAKDRTLDDGFIAIHGGRIVGLGATRERPPSLAAREILDAHRNLVMPGLIDTHLHVTQQLLRGLDSSPDTGQKSFVCLSKICYNHRQCLGQSNAERRHASS